MPNFLKHLDILWMDYLKDRSTDEPLEEYWDDTHNSEQYQEHIRRLGYPGTILDKIYLSLTPESTVLDIGAGHGTFCIPIAKKVRSVTAIEPSSGQIAKILKLLFWRERRNIELCLTMPVMQSSYTMRMG